MFPKPPKLEGKFIRLGQMKPEYIPAFFRWMTDKKVVRTIQSRLDPPTLAAERKWYRAAAKKRLFLAFAIRIRSNGKLIGTVSLATRKPADRTAEFGIMIGERSEWGKGYGTEATKLILRYAFASLKLHSVYLRVYAPNVGGILAYRRAGFRLVGRQREAKRWEKGFVDILTMDVLKSEWRRRSRRGG